MRVLFLLLFLTTPALTQQPVSPAQLQRWRTAIRHDLYVPDRLPPLEARTWSTFAPVAGVLAERVTYATADGMLVPAIVYSPAASHGKLPGIVVVNGHGGDKYSWYAFYTGMLFARAGAVVVTYDPIGEGERNIDRQSRTGAHDRLIPTPAGVPADDSGRRLAGLMQVDLMQAVAFLRQRPDVDSARIATVGYSMGAFVSGITGAIDPDIHAVLLSGGGTFDDEADGGKSFDTSKLPCQGPPWRSLGPVLQPPPGFPAKDFRGAVLYALNARRGPMLVINGSADEVMDIPHRGPDWFAAIRADAASLLSPDARAEANLFTTHVDPGKGHRPAWVERPGVTWLNEQLHFPNWTPADIAAMPTTLISTWAAAHGVDITRNYLRPDREGGLQALDPVAPADLPGLTRDQLTVLPLADWQRLQTRLTYVNWAANTMAAERAMPPR